MKNAKYTLITDDGVPSKRPHVSSVRRSQVSLLLFGIALGYFLAILIQFSPNSLMVNLRNIHSDPHDSSDMADLHGPERDVNFHEAHSHENSSIAQKLFEEVRVLCWIMTGPENHKTKAMHVKKTWGKRCNKILFMSSKEDAELGSIALPVKEGRNNLWAKTKEAFKYVYKNHLDEADFVLKADDDTYVIMENLRYMLYSYLPSQPLYFGCRFKPMVKQGYMSGGAGYVLSRQALKQLMTGIDDPSKCRQGADGNEDLEMGKCLENVNVTAMDTRDSLERGRFFPFIPEHHIIPDHTTKDFWYWKYIYYDVKDGMDCCSDYAISFHYVSPNQMYVLEYLIYHLRPYGIVNFNEPLPERSWIEEYGNGTEST